MSNRSRITRRAVPPGGAIRTALRRSLVGLVLAGACAQAAWTDMREGLDPKEVAEQVGQPLMHSSVRGGKLETWIFDDGGYILFENGRVRFWSVPRTKKP
ncbi:MAG: hypothetical protein NTV51_13760 [Verrucomicrobia bacterium]|nr:hypothetical protein [Verrucomicrobiota bacterium]